MKESHAWKGTSVRDLLLEAYERKDWPAVTAFALQGRRELYADAGPGDAALALIPGIGRKRWQVLSGRSGAER